MLCKPESGRVIWMWNWFISQHLAPSTTTPVGEQGEANYGPLPRLDNREMLWEHIRWGGSTLWIPSGSWVFDLSYYGWNDRTSSFAAYS